MFYVFHRIRQEIDSHRSPHQHIASYVYGVWFGSRLSSSKNVFCGKRHLVLGILCMYMSVYLPKHIQIERFAFSVYYTIHRLTFVIGMSAVVGYCVNNRQSMVNRLLDNSLTNILGKLTFTAYLAQQSLCYFFIRNRDDLLIVTHQMLFVYTLTIFVTSYFIALVIYLLFEGPMSNWLQNKHTDKNK